MIITRNHSEAAPECFRIVSGQFSPLSFFFVEIFDFSTSNMTNFPPVVFLIYKFVSAETLQKVSSGDLVFGKNLESQNDWSNFSQLVAGGKPSTLYPPGSL